MIGRSGAMRVAGRAGSVLLLGLGAFLLVLAPIVRFHLAEKVVGARADTYGVTRLTAKDARYFSADELKVVTGDLAITVTTRGDVAESSGDRVVWDRFTTIDDVTRGGSTVARSLFHGAFDRRTGTGLDCCGANVDSRPVTPSGQLFRFPVGAGKRTYPVYDTAAGRAYAATFAGADTVRGLRVYRYEQKVPPTRIRTLTAPASALGLGGSGTVQVDRWADGTNTFWVEPASGVPVKVERRRHEVLKTRDGVERTPAFVATATFTPRTVADRVRQATDARRLITLLTTTVPLVLLVAGLVFVAAGAAPRLRRRAE
jgi:hypothetical protein